MGLFFEKRAKKKRTKPFISIKILIIIALMFMLAMAIIKGNDLYFLGLFTLLGINSIIDGIESYFQKEDKRIYLLGFGFGVIWFTLAFQFSKS